MTSHPLAPAACLLKEFVVRVDRNDVVYCSKSIHQKDKNKRKRPDRNSYNIWQHLSKKKTIIPQNLKQYAPAHSQPPKPKTVYIHDKRLYRILPTLFFAASLSSKKLPSTPL